MNLKNNKLLQNLSALLLLLLLAGPSFAQRSISGSVTDETSGEPLIGANILVAGTSTGTATDFDGNFTLEVSETATELRISYTGYAEKIVALTATNNYVISMAEGTLLEEVVVIGYGSVKREDATGSIQQVNAEDFNRGAITSPQELLAGKVAGVQITTPGDPGGKSIIRIRGGSSLSASNDPLIVIDGVPVANDDVSGARNPLNIINPNDIESITVLKDASATAIYGSRASNGVILVTTKKGKLGKKISIDYNGSISTSSVAQTLEVLSASEYRALIEERFDEGHPARGILGSADTDWQDVVYQQAFGQDHNLNFSGGIGFLPYRLSLGLSDKEGIVQTDKFNRKTVALNLTPGFLDNTLQVKLSGKYMQVNNRFADKGAIGAAVAFDPTQPVLDSESPFGGYYTWVQDSLPNTIATKNPLALLEQKNNRSSVYRYILGGQIDYRFPFLPELRANLNLAYDYSKGEGTEDIPEIAAFSFSDGGLDKEYEQIKRNELLEFYLNYGKDFGSSSLNVLGGYSWQRFFKDFYEFATNVSGSEVITPEKLDPKENYLISLFGRVNYSIQDRYLVTATLRRDGTSRFSPDNRWGLFPAAALAWKVVDSQSPKGALSNLKLRVGWGVTGQQDLNEDFYPYLPRYVASQENAEYIFGDSTYTTLRPGGYDINLKWEETTTYNIGVDFGFLNDRITGSVELYQRDTRDLLNFINVPAGSNLTNFINTNVGDLTNRGVEFSLNATAIRKENFNWDIGFNVTANQNEITKLTATDDPNYEGVITGGIAGGVGNNIQIHRVGFPANSFYVFEQVYDDNGLPIEGLYVDRNNDGQITPDDRYILENPAPDLFFGFNTALSYQSFELSMAGRATVGNYVYNNNLSNLGNYNSLYNSTNYLENIHANYASIDFAVPQFFSDHFIQNGSFLRIDHVTLSYTLPKFFDKLSFAKVFATVQNPLLITQYDGIDPEILEKDNYGIDKNLYPRSRTILFGLNVNF